jgi:hypothetical protein
MRTLPAAMMILAAMVFLCSISPVVFAETPKKNDDHIGANPGKPDGREGGETVDDAIVIAALPFTDTGNTSDNVDDYDEVCLYTGSLSPDVVYTYTPVSDEGIFITLCESGYDTKLYVYEDAVTPGNPYACNDDYADCVLVYRSFLPGLMLYGGHTYYIVVDGYGGDMGDYIIDIGEEVPCKCAPIECPENSVAEGEPALEEDYIDEYNGGCDADPVAFQLLDFPLLCGHSGWYYAGGELQPDADWFTCLANEGGEVAITIITEYALLLRVMLPTDCSNTEIAYDYFCDYGASTHIEFSHPAGTDFWLNCEPANQDVSEVEFLYFMSLDGIILEDPAPTNSDSWGAMKVRFR